MIVYLCAVAARGKGMCFFLSAQQVRMCTALWQDCPVGKAQWVLRVQLLPRGGLVWSCCVVETYSTHGKALLRRGMMICIFTGWCLFPCGTQWKKMLVWSRMLQIVPFCDPSFPALLLDDVWSCQCCSISTECQKCPWPERCVPSNQPTWTCENGLKNGYVEMRHHFQYRVIFFSCCKKTSSADVMLLSFWQSSGVWSIH